MVGSRSSAVFGWNAGGVGDLGRAGDVCRSSAHIHSCIRGRPDSYQPAIVLAPCNDCVTTCPCSISFTSPKVKRLPAPDVNSQTDGPKPSKQGALLVGIQSAFVRLLTSITTTTTTTTTTTHPTTAAIAYYYFYYCCCCYYYYY